MRELHHCQDKNFFESTCTNGRHCNRSNDTEKLKKTCSYDEQISHDKSTVTILPDIGLTTSDSTLNTCSLRGKEDLRTPFRRLKNESQIVQDVCPPLAAHTQNTRHISTRGQPSNEPDLPHRDTQVHPFCSISSSGESITVGSMSGAELLIVSTTSLAHLTRSRSELSSVPSLPTIQSTIRTGDYASNSKMDGKGTGRERRLSSGTTGPRSSLYCCQFENSVWKSRRMGCASGKETELQKECSVCKAKNCWW